MACYLDKCIKSSLLGQVLGAAIVLGALVGCSEQSAPKKTAAGQSSSRGLERHSTTPQRSKEGTRCKEQGGVPGNHRQSQV